MYKLELIVEKVELQTLLIHYSDEKWRKGRLNEEATSTQVLIPFLLLHNVLEKMQCGVKRTEVDEPAGGDAKARRRPRRRKVVTASGHHTEYKTSLVWETRRL